VVGELTKAMERIGLDMRVSALVSNLVAVPGFSVWVFSIKWQRM
jgi:hypothetical protein